MRWNIDHRWWSKKMSYFSMANIKKIISTLKSLLSGLDVQNYFARVVNTCKLQVTSTWEKVHKNATFWFSKQYSYNLNTDDLQIHPRWRSLYCFWCCLVTLSAGNWYLHFNSFLLSDLFIVNETYLCNGWTGPLACLSLSSVMSWISLVLQSGN